MSSNEEGNSSDLDTTPGKTGVRGLEKPKKYEDWQTVFYKLAEMVDRDLPLRGTTSERPDDPPIGFEYHNTERNHKKRYIGDGDWVVTGGTGNKDNPLPTTFHVEGAAIQNLDNPDVEDALSTAQSAQDSAGSAANLADKAEELAMEAKNIADAAEQAAGSAKDTADAAQTTAKSAKEDASTALDKAEQAEKDAKAALDKANKLDDRVSTLETDVANIDDRLSTAENDISTLETDVSNLQSNKVDVAGDQMGGALDFNGHSAKNLGQIAPNTVVLPSSF